MKWQVADCLGTFYRPNFETQIYPYCPTHIERPKETKKLFLVNLPEKAFLTVRSCRVNVSGTPPVRSTLSPQPA